MMLWRLRLRSASHVAPTACTPTCTTCWSTTWLSLGSMESPRDSAKSHHQSNCLTLAAAPDGMLQRSLPAATSSRWSTRPQNCWL